ncbi:MAG: cell division protein FtsL [Erysipelotrichaceae bacterium]|nr:cell division protein FtsL [Erysipelotrichaceae bacterium]
MAKIRRRKRRRNYLNMFAVIMLTLAFISLILTSLFVGTYNQSLTISIQKMNNEIDTLKSENEKLNIEIASLENKDRVYIIAQDAGLDQNQDNVISIQGEN